MYCLINGTKLFKVRLSGRKCFSFEEQIAFQNNFILFILHMHYFSHTQTNALDI